MPRTAVTHVRWTPAQKREIERQAKRRKTTASALIRAAVKVYLAR